MERLRQWFSATPSPPRTPPPGSDAPVLINWSPYLNLQAGTALREEAHDASLRRRLVRLPGDGKHPCGPDDCEHAILAAAPVIAWPGPECSASPRMRRRLADAFDAVDVEVDRKHTRPMVRLTHIPSVSPVLAGFLARRAGMEPDLAAIRTALLTHEASLSPAEVEAFARALATAAIGSARPASRGMERLVRHLLAPVETHLGPAILGALTRGLQQACIRLRDAKAPGHTARGLGVAQDVLSRHIAQARQRMGPVRQADIPGLIRIAMAGAVMGCVDDFQCAVDAQGQSEAAGLRALRAGKGSFVVDTTKGRARVYDEESVQRAADELLQQRHEAALEAAVARVMRLLAHLGLDHRPAFLLAEAEGLRQQEVQAGKPEVAVVSLAVANALERRAQALLALRQPAAASPGPPVAPSAR